MSMLKFYFADFLGNIRLTDAQIEDCKMGHTVLRKRLLGDEDLSSIIIDTFLQGSYRRSTAVRPAEESKLMDVDVIIVTDLDKESIKPQEALDEFKPFLKKYYKGKYEAQGRSWGIKLSYVNLDLVPTSAPSEANKSMFKSASVTTDRTLEESVDWTLKPSWKPENQRTSSSQAFLRKLAEEEVWKTEPLWIPDREVQQWDETDPLSQIQATSEKNGVCNGHFVNVVKCLKWWRTTQKPEPKHPKSYPLEHLIWTCCPDNIQSVAEGIVKTLESIRDKYKNEAMFKQVPILPDHGVPHHNVLARLSGDDWASFHSIVTEAAELARNAFNEEKPRESAVLWKKLFGDKFPAPPETDEDDNTSKRGGFTPRKDKSIIPPGRFA